MSLPESLWNAVDAHAATDPNSGDRSSYIQRLVTDDLAAAGKLPGSPEAEAQAEARELIAIIGPERFRKIMKEAAKEAA